VMAAIAGAPLVHVFNLRERGWHYHFFGFPPQRPVMPAHDKRDEYLHACVARFSDDLQSVLKRDPLQWYNFYPFWQKPHDSSAAPEAANIQDAKNPSNGTFSDEVKDTSVFTSVAVNGREAAFEPAARRSP